MRLQDHFYGNGDIVALLSEQIAKRRIPRALLLEGETGLGKRTLATLVAAGVFSLGTDKSSEALVTRVLGGSHPDVHYTGGEGGSKSFHVDTIRQLRNKAFWKPVEASASIYILLGCENMTIQSQNALLKLIEDPPASSLFILTCVNRHAMLPTILSRLTLLRLHPLPVEECTRRLMERFPAKGEAACSKAAKAAEGNFGQALLLLCEGEGTCVADAARNIYNAWLTGDRYTPMAVLVPYENKRESYRQLLVCLEKLFAAALVEAGGSRQSFSLQCIRIVAIIKESIRKLEFNVGLSSLSCLLVSTLFMRD